MKQFLPLSIIVLLLWAHPLWSQRSSSPFVGALNQITQQQHTFRWSFSPMVGLQWQRHQLAAGPVILLKDFSGTLEHLPRLTGMQLNYRYLLTPTVDKPLCMFAEFSSKAQFMNENWISNYWNPTIEDYQDVKQGSREKLWQNYAGLGMHYRIHTQVYLQLSGGVGYSISRLKKIGASPDANDQSFDYRGYDPQSMMYSLNLGCYLKL